MKNDDWGPRWTAIRPGPLLAKLWDKCFFETKKTGFCTLEPDWFTLSGFDYVVCVFLGRVEWFNEGLVYKPCLVEIVDVLFWFERAIHLYSVQVSLFSLHKSI